MAFITNQRGEGEGKLETRLREPIGHTDQLDMLVGFFYFSGVKIFAEAFRDRPQLKLCVLVGMDAELVLGQLVEIAQKGGPDSADAIRERFCESMKKVLESERGDNEGFHERLGIFIAPLESKRLERACALANVAGGHIVLGVAVRDWARRGAA